MPTQQRLDELEEQIETLRGEWRQAPTVQDKAVIERRARCLIWAKEKIESCLKPDLYQTAKAIFSGSGDSPGER